MRLTLKKIGLSIFTLLIPILSLFYSSNAFANSATVTLNWTSVPSTYLPQNQRTLIGVMDADAGMYMTAFTGLLWGISKGGSMWTSGTVSSYGETGYYEFTVTDGSGNVLWDSSKNNFGPQYIVQYSFQAALQSMNLATPVSELRFYVTYAASEPPPYSYPENYEAVQGSENWNGVQYYFNQATVTEVDQITAETLTAAQGAQTDAQAAQTAAQNAQNGTNTIINSYLSTSAGIVQDSSGNTVLSVAKQASQNALLAQSSANTAATNAANANTTLGTSAGVVQDSSGTVLQSARQAVTGINNAQTALSNQINSLQTNLNNNFTNMQTYIPPTLNKVSGYNNAVATTGTTFQVSLDYSGANEYQVKVDNGSWSGWTSLSSHDTNGYFTVSGISNTGLHTIYIQIRTNNGTTASPVANGKMTVWKV